MRNFFEYHQIFLDNEFVNMNQRPQHHLHWQSKNFNFEMTLLWVPYLHNFTNLEVRTLKKVPLERHRKFTAPY
jgi:hypothetical protein